MCKCLLNSYTNMLFVIGARHRIPSTKFSTFSGSQLSYRDGPGFLALCVYLRKFQLSLSVCGVLDF